MAEWPNGRMGHGALGIGDGEWPNGRMAEWGMGHWISL